MASNERSAGIAEAQNESGDARNFLIDDDMRIVNPLEESPDMKDPWEQPSCTETEGHSILESQQVNRGRYGPRHHSEATN